MLYRVAQEALTNVARHARARHTCVSLRRKGGEVILGVSDDGTGFTPDAATSAPRGLGLAGMRERLALVGGRLTVHFSPAPAHGWRRVSRSPRRPRMLSSPPRIRAPPGDDHPIRASASPRCWPPSPIWSSSARPATARRP